MFKFFIWLLVISISCTRNATFYSLGLFLSQNIIYHEFRFQNTPFFTIQAKKFELLQRFKSDTNYFVQNNHSFIQTHVSFQDFNDKLITTLDIMKRLTRNNEENLQKIHYTNKFVTTSLNDLESIWDKIVIDASSHLAQERLAQFNLELIETIEKLNSYFNGTPFSQSEKDYYEKWDTLIQKTIHLFKPSSPKYEYFRLRGIHNLEKDLSTFKFPMEWFNRGFMERFRHMDENDAWWFAIQISYVTWSWVSLLNE